MLVNTGPPLTRQGGTKSDGLTTTPGLSAGLKDPNSAQQLHQLFVRETIEAQKRNGRPYAVKESGLGAQIFANVKTAIVGATMSVFTDQYTKRLVSAQRLRGEVETIRSLEIKKNQAQFPHRKKPAQSKTGSAEVRADLPYDPEGEMQIGFTRLIIPPERVQVREVTASTEVPGLRTNSTNLVKTGRGRIQISLDLVFEGEKMIDTSLRELIAQFRAYPYVPVVSPYLVRLIQPKVAIPPDDKTVRGIVARRADTLQKVANARFEALRHLEVLSSQFPKVQEVLQANGDFLDAKFNFLSIVDIDRLSGVSERLVQEYRKAVLADGAQRPTGPAVIKAVTRFTAGIENLRFTLLELQRLTFQEMQIQIGGLIDPGNGVVPCVLDTIQVTTVDDRPDMLRAKLTLLYFNATPYGGVLRYRDFYGRTTVDPYEAVYMRRQVDSWFTNRDAPPPLVSDLLEQETATPRALSRPDARGLNIKWLGRWGGKRLTSTPGVFDTTSVDAGGLIIEYATIDFQSDSAEVIQRKNADGAGGLGERLKGQAPRWRKLDLQNRAGVTVTHISTGLGNRLALQPVPGDFFPSMQYIGGKPGRMSITLEITDQQVLTEVHAMKISNQRSTTLGMREWRRPEVHIRNKVLNLMGFWSAQIDGVTTQSVSPNTTRVTLELSEHRVDETERGVIRRPEVFSETKLEEIFGYLFTQASKAQDTARLKQMSKMNARNQVPLRQSKIAEIEDRRRDLRNANSTTPQYSPQAFDLDLRTASARRDALSVDSGNIAAAELLFGNGITIERDSIYTGGAPKTAPASSKSFLKSVADFAVPVVGLLNVFSPEATTEKSKSTTGSGLVTLDVLERIFDGKSEEGKEIRRRIAAQFEMSDPEKQSAQAVAQFVFGKITGSTNTRTVNQGDPEFDRLLDIHNARLYAKQLGLREGSNDVRPSLQRGARSPDGLESYFVQYGPKAPPPDLLKALAAFYARSQANAQDELTFDEASGEVKLLDNKGDDISQHAVTLLRLMAAVMEDKVRPADTKSLRSLVLGKASSIEEFLRNKRGQFQGVYRDLNLPTYRIALTELIQAILNNRQRNNNAHNVVLSNTLDIESFNDLTLEERALLAPFVPTYEELGKIPSLDSEGKALSMQDFAYDIDDQVTPDFPYFGRKLTPEINKIKTAVDARKRRGDKKARRSFAGEDTAGTKTLGDPLSQLKAQQIFDAEREQYGGLKDDVASQKLATLNKDSLLSEEPTDVLLTRSYGPGRYRASFGDFKGDTPEQMKNIFDAAVLSEGDRSAKMARAFPTLRLFFIEEDTREASWTAIDDIYGFNAVISLNVTRHKYQPDLAEIMLSNLEGGLEYDRFHEADTKNGKSESADEDGVRPSAQDAIGPTERGTNERLLNVFPLNEGTRIMIQLGFESHEAHLDTVFTGKIAEVQMGDIVKIVAQSYLQELLYPLPEAIGTEQLGSITEHVMQGPTVDHFGRRSPLWFRNADKIELDNARFTGPSTVLSRNAGIVFADPKLKNVFTAKYTNWWSKTASQLIENSWETGGGVKTGWDIIQDSVNYSPGYIAAVVPYDLEATLFVGRPEQPYFWTDGLRAEEKKFRDTTAAVDFNVSNVANDILRRFTSSVEYHGNYQTDSDVVAMRKKQAEADNANIGAKDLLVSGLGAFHYAGHEGNDTNTLLFKIQLASQIPFWTAVIEARFRANNRFGTISVHASNQERPKLQLAVRNALNVGRKIRAAEEFDQIIEMLGDDKEAIVLDTIFRAVSRGTLSRAGTLQRRLGAGTIGYPEGRGLTGEELMAQTAFRQLPDAYGVLAEIWPGKAGPGATATQRQKENSTPGYNGIRDALLKRTAEFDKKFGIGSGTKHLEALIAWMTRFQASIPMMLKSLREYLLADPLLTSVIKLTPGTDKWPLNPRTKPFRSYHMITNFDDLIENQISATRGAMYNGVAISKSGKETPLTLWADNGIIKGDRILRYFHEPNADVDLMNFGQSESTPEASFTLNKYLVGFSRLAQGLRPMYRGQLVCRGRPDIKPWDIVHVHDHYNNIFGPIEVERVTHHFSAETGFITTITPHLVATANNQVDSWNILSTGWLYGGVAATAVLAGTALLLLAPLALGAGALISVGLGIGAAIGGKSLADYVLSETTGATIWGNFVGEGKHGDAKIPVKIIPLTRHGYPWTAGLRGYGRDQSGNVPGIIFENFKEKAQDFYTGASRLGGLALDDLKGLSGLQQGENYFRQE